MKNSKRKNNFLNWHFWPRPKNFPILSIWEFIIYCILLAISMWFYFKCQIVPVFSIESDLNHVYVGTNDSTKACRVNIIFRMPMTKVMLEEPLPPSDIERNLALLNSMKGCYGFSIRFLDDTEKIYYDKYRKYWGALELKYDSLYHLYKEVCQDSLLPISNSIFYLHTKIESNGIKQFSRKRSSKWGVSRLLNSGEDSINLCQKISYKEESLIVESFHTYNVVALFEENKDMNYPIFSRPKWYSEYDISQSYYYFRINGDYTDNSTLKIDFVGVTQFSNMIPEPDVASMNSIVFSDPEKIKQIKENGLQFHATFTELQNSQNSRMFFVTALLCALIAIIITFCIISIYKIIRKTKESILYYYRIYKFRRYKWKKKETTCKEDAGVQEDKNHLVQEKESV